MSLIYPLCGDSSINFTSYFETQKTGKRNIPHVATVENFEDRIIVDKTNVIFKDTNKFDEFMVNNEFITSRIKYNDANIEIDHSGYIYADINNNNLESHEELANHLYNSVRCYIENYDENAIHHMKYVDEHFSLLNGTMSSSEDSVSGCGKIIISVVLMILVALSI